MGSCHTAPVDGHRADGVDDGVSATRHAWVHMLQAGMLRSSDPFSALAHVAQALELLQTDMTRNATTSEKMNYAASNAASNAAFSPSIAA